jgi:hypothetical protein
MENSHNENKNSITIKKISEDNVNEVRIDKIVTDFASKKNESTETNIEIWEDLINIKDLVMALTICIITTFGGYTLSPNESYKPLLFGLVGAIFGFIISSFLIDPKREVIQEKKEL